MSAAPEKDLLFGLLALQIGLIDQAQLVAAFQAWTLNRERSLADHLVARRDVDQDDRTAVDALVARHLKKHGDDVERSLAAVPAGRSTREQLARLGDPAIGATLSGIGSAVTEHDTDTDRTDGHDIGTAVCAGQRFRVLRPHARGGLGTVFVALDTELHREVALKEISESHADDPVSRARFLLEAEVTGGLEHPGIVPVYGLGSYLDGRPYYAMRFIRGDSLKEAIDQFHALGGPRRDPGCRSLELRKLLSRFIDVCNAIEYAHSRGVLHRDIKPGNIIVGRHGETLVVDWGLAKATGKSDPFGDERTLVPSSASGSAATLPGRALGTPGYMSPEQAEGNLEHLGAQSDVYSLGATLYCLLTGRPPFTGDVAAILRSVQRGEFQPPRLVARGIDPALEAVCLKAMARRPAERYSSCRALAEEIERWMADEPVTAWREPVSRRARRWIGRNRTAVTAAAVALLCGVVGLATVAGVQARANVALTQANRTTSRALAETRKAQAETQQALAQSEQSREQAEAVSAFLVEAFRSPDPAQTGRDVKMADVLDKASARLEQEFGGSPLTKGVLLDALGRTYRGLGLFDRAVSLHARACELREAALGPDHPDTLKSRNRLGNAYSDAGRLVEAIAVHEETLKRREAALGPDHPDTLSSRNNLATDYRVAGRLSEAIALHEATLKLREAVLGPDDPDTLASRVNLATAYASAGRVSEAIALDEVTLKQFEATLGPDHPDTLTSRSNLADDYREAGRLAEAVPLLEATLKLKEAKLGPGHDVTLDSRLGLAAAYEVLGRSREAEALYRGTLLRRRKVVKPDSSLLANDLALLGRHLTKQSRWSEAERLMREAVAIRANATPDAWERYDAMSLLGGSLSGQGRYADAEPLIVAGYQGMKAREARIFPLDRPRLLEAAERLVRLYEACNRRDEAALWKAKLGMPDLPPHVFVAP
jgi:tetratricopeptide (TPR) repeat protein/tRNA A-37 threonylcarbamoyl transferase component Bud32